MLHPYSKQHVNLDIVYQLLHENQLEGHTKMKKLILPTTGVVCMTFFA